METVDHDELAERFEEHRPRLRSLAYRLLGSLSEADDAVQETWLRLDRVGGDHVDSLGAWLTTVATRVCLNTLRSRERRRETPMEPHVPDPVVGPEDGADPEHEALLADSVGLAMMVVLETLSLDERLCFVLHDMFAVPFDDIAEVLERSSASVRQLASRARRRVRDRAPVPDADLRRQRDAVDAFFAAAREGDFDALVATLAPDVVLRSDGGDARPGLTLVLRGPREVTGQAVRTAALSPYLHPVLVNGAAGALVAPDGRPMAVMAFTVSGGRIAAIDVLADPDRLAALDLPPVGV
ncbi:RNA polymerase sigma factor SigJ [Nocardiopsis aegyptia]